MIEYVLTRIFGTQHERELKSFIPLVEKINSLESQMQALSNEQLQKKTAEFKEQIKKGRSLEDLLPESFAVCREASYRVLGLRHYDVQLIGGVVLHRGQIAEMKTGEGKTLVATLPIYLNALAGKGCHVVTVNDYLAKRDTEWMGQVYNWLGLSTGTIVHDLTDQERKKAYGADITYGTNNEFGFDYLRDNMKFDQEHCVQRELNFAIVDECDSILIDEARTPLIISGPKEDSTEKYHHINRIIPQLIKDQHFTMEEKSKTVSLTEEGNTKVEQLLNIKNLYDIAHIDLVHHIYQGLKAHYLFKRDVDYMIKNNEIVIVDEFTGRLMPGRRWSDGLHQAIEAKEKVQVKKENQTLASVTFQNYFRMYSKLAGMTGTAETEAVEFSKIYSLDVFVVPTNKPIKRDDRNDVVYKNQKGKFKAIVEEIKITYKKGQPILVGTVSIENSERLSRILTEEGIGHHVLNAKHHEKEAEIIAQAGRWGAVTIATNMAGRGTDIVLGGNPEFLSRAELSEDADEKQKKSSLEKFKNLCEEEKQKVLEAGGLYIIGTERHESRRIDNQLRGRSGRQGDPGASRFYLSLEDDLMRIFGGQSMQRLMDKFNIPEEEAITNRLITRQIAYAQKRVEGHNFDIRKHLLEYDNVMNQQRTVIYQKRRNIMDLKKVERQCLDFLSEVTSSLLDTYVSEQAKPEQWNLKGLEQAVYQQFGFTLPEISSVGRLADSVSEPAINQEGNPSISNVDSGVVSLIKSGVKTAYDAKKEEFKEHFIPLVQLILLQTLDARWKGHLENIDRLKEGINLRAYAQKDPLVEYKKESFALFERMSFQITSESIEKLFKIQIQRESDSDDKEDPYKMTQNYNEQEWDYEKPLINLRDSHRLKSNKQPPSSGPQRPLNRAQRRSQKQLKKKKIKI
ncbi:MAG: preprotein translocase subunit SecA [Bdellovibrionales bacterium]|nr:preprotein translocase subunit SecA [Bdellovibrionales bacterium]